MHSITARHNFETAHRLPHLEGKCRSLHGHSWWVTITVSANRLSGQGIVTEYGAFKRVMRSWIDTRLDHGTMLGADDPLVMPLRGTGCKLFIFGPRQDWSGALWPTVEAVAGLLAYQADEWLSAIPGVAPDAHISRVHVAETAVNAAEWTAE